MTLTAYTRRCFIAVPVAQQQVANAICENLVKGGAGTFTVQWPPQDETGTVIPKFYLCDWQMLPETYTDLKAAFVAARIDATFYDRDSWDPALCVRVTYSTVDTDLKLKTGALSLAQVAALPHLAVAAKGRAVARSWWLRFVAWLRRLVRWFRHLLHRESP